MCRTDTALGSQASSLRRSAPRFHMGERLRDLKGANVPGPGSYGDMRLDYVQSKPPPPRPQPRKKVVIDA